MSTEIPDSLLLYLVVGFIALILIVYISVKVFDKYRPKLAKKIRGYSFRLGLSLLILIFIAMVIFPLIVLPISSGHVGVLWKRFGGGTVLGIPFAEGSIMVLPWDRLIRYQTRFQITNIQVNAVTSEGLKIALHIDLRHILSRKKVPLLHKIIGEEYINILLIPEVESSSRLVISGYTAEQVYGPKREKIQHEIYVHAVESLLLRIEHTLDETEVDDASELVLLEDILIRDVILPEKVDMAIINKVNQTYLNQEYAIRLEVSKKEAIRKSVEAKGIADFQATVVGGISETYLRWRGIEATLELAKSNNSKIVVIGGGKDGLPLILNTAESTISAKPEAEPINPDLEKKNE